MNQGLVKAPDSFANTWQGKCQQIAKWIAWLVGEKSLTLQRN